MNEDKANVDSLDQTVILGANPRGSADVKPGLVATLPDGYEFSGHRIDGLIGIGGFGVVYKATDLALGRVVALKEYFPHAMAQRGPSHRVTMQQSRDQATFQAGMSSFINEARLLAKFDHTSLVKVFQFWEAHQTAYMSMPYIPGFTLKASFEQFGHPVNEQSLTTILCELARALSEMHQHRCYHRDISPDNIIMHAETGLPVLLDFGAARQAIQNQTHSFTVILKSGYAPVEQYSDIHSLNQGAWTDVYALGALAYWMITGQAPPAAVSRMVNDTALRLESSDYTEKFSVPFLRTIDLALAIMPEDRLQSAQAFIDLLTEAPLAHSRALAGSASETLNRLNGGRPAFRRLGSGLAIGLSVAIGLIALLGGSWLFKSEPQTQTNQSELPSENVGASTPNPQIQARNETKELGPPPTDATVSIVSKQQVLAIDRDWLELEIESEAEGYLSIFVLGSDQTLLQLLPKANNQLVWLEKGETFQFPSRDEPMVASGPEGTNRFVAVISTQPLDGLDLPKTAYFDFWQIQWPGHAFPDRLYNRLQTYFGCEGVACASHFHAGEATVMSVAKP